MDSLTARLGRLKLRAHQKPLTRHGNSGGTGVVSRECTPEDNVSMECGQPSSCRYVRLRAHMLQSSQSPSFLTTALYPHQWAGLIWMCAQECMVCAGCFRRFQSEIHKLLPSGGVDLLAGATVTQNDRRFNGQCAAGGGIVADACGLGKTFLALALIAFAGENDGSTSQSTLPSLIICPKSVLSVWEEHIASLLEVKPQVYIGSGRRKTLEGLRTALNERNGSSEHAGTVVVTSYGTLRSDWKANTPDGADGGRHTGGNGPCSLFDITWARVICDEGHILRNCKTQTWQAAVGLEVGVGLREGKRREVNTPLLSQGGGRWVLSATPIQNSVNDLYGLLKFTRQCRWTQKQFRTLAAKVPSLSAISSSRCTSIGSDKVLLQPVEAFSNALLACMLRRSKVVLAARSDDKVVLAARSDDKLVTDTRECNDGDNVPRGGQERESKTRPLLPDKTVQQVILEVADPAERALLVAVGATFRDAASLLRNASGPSLLAMTDAGMWERWRGKRSHRPSSILRSDETDELRLLRSTATLAVSLRLRQLCNHGPDVVRNAISAVGYSFVMLRRMYVEVDDGEHRDTCETDTADNTTNSADSPCTVKNNKYLVRLRHLLGAAECHSGRSLLLSAQLAECLDNVSDHIGNSSGDGRAGADCGSETLSDEWLALRRGLPNWTERQSARRLFHDPLSVSQSHAYGGDGFFTDASAGFATLMSSRQGRHRLVTQVLGILQYADAVIANAPSAADSDTDAARDLLSRWNRQPFHRRYERWMCVMTCLAFLQRAYCSRVSCECGESGDTKHQGAVPQGRVPQEDTAGCKCAATRLFDALSRPVCDLLCRSVSVLWLCVAPALLHIYLSPQIRGNTSSADDPPHTHTVSQNAMHTHTTLPPTVTRHELPNPHSTLRLWTGSTKIAAVERVLHSIWRSETPYAKVVVFSQWVRSLRMLAKHLQYLQLQLRSGHSAQERKGRNSVSQAEDRQVCENDNAGCTIHTVDEFNYAKRSIENGRSTVIGLAEPDVLSYDFAFFTGGLSEMEKSAALRKWRDPRSHTRVLLVSLQGGGVGLTLTAAHHLVLLDSWWNPQMELQAMDRVHRIGQQHPVTVYKLSLERSVEQRIIKLQHSKGKEAASVLDRYASVSKVGTIRKIYRFDGESEGGIEGNCGGGSGRDKATEGNECSAFRSRRKTTVAIKILDDEANTADQNKTNVKDKTNAAGCDALVAGDPMDASRSDDLVVSHSTSDGMSAGAGAAAGVGAAAAGSSRLSWAALKRRARRTGGVVRVISRSPAHMASTEVVPEDNSRSHDISGGNNRSASSNMSGGSIKSGSRAGLRDDDIASHGSDAMCGDTLPDNERTPSPVMMRSRAAFGSSRNPPSESKGLRDTPHKSGVTLEANTHSQGTNGARTNANWRGRHVSQHNQTTRASSGHQSGKLHDKTGTRRAGKSRRQRRNAKDRRGRRSGGHHRQTGNAGGAGAGAGAGGSIGRDGSNGRGGGTGRNGTGHGVNNPATQNIHSQRDPHFSRPQKAQKAYTEQRERHQSNAHRHTGGSVKVVKPGSSEEVEGLRVWLESLAIKK